MSALDDLYQQMIIEHNRNPKNFRCVDGATHVAEGFNPICGDHYTIYLTIGDDDVIRDVAFDGKGCAISKASASLMTQALKGKTRAEAESMFEAFHKPAVGESDGAAKDKLGKLAVFSGISKYPARVKCAVLSWHAMHSALNRIKVVSTE